MIKREVVLPSGRFASMRTMTWGDLVACYDTVNVARMSAKLAACLVSIDGQPLTIDQIMQMEAAEFFPINEIICKEITAALKYKNGIA